jgi:hypothetical protein
MRESETLLRTTARNVNAIVRRRYGSVASTAASFSGVLAMIAMMSDDGVESVKCSSFQPRSSADETPPRAARGFRSGSRRRGGAGSSRRDATTPDRERRRAVTGNARARVPALASSTRVTRDRRNAFCSF